jgi:purine-binding chemotaxis protein CheW
MTESRQLCTFMLGDFYFGIDVLKVQEIIRHQEMTQVPLAPASIRGLINLRGQIVTALDLRCRLGLPPRPAGLPSTNVVIHTADGPVSLLVDEIGDVLEVDPATLGRAPDTVRGAARQVIDGVYRLKDRLLILLDTERVVAVQDVAAITATV